MTAKEKINRNIGLCFDFLRQVLDNPKMLNRIPNGSELEFVDKDFPLVERKSKSRTSSKKKFLRVKSHLEVIS